MLLVVSAFSLLLGCSKTLGKNDVLVIKKTNTYHRENCPPVNMAKTTVMTVAEAKADNYKPCPAFKSDSVNTNGTNK